MMVIKKGCVSIIVVAACLFNCSCSTSDSVQDNRNLGNGDDSFDVLRPETELLRDTTVLVEILVFEKPIDNQSSALVNQVQVSSINFNDVNVGPSLLDLESQATRHLGAPNPDGLSFRDEFRACMGDLEKQEFNYIVRSTDSSGSVVNFVNTDICGFVPNFEFGEIDGQVPILQITSLIFHIENL